MENNAFYYLLALLHVPNHGSNIVWVIITKNRYRKGEGDGGRDLETIRKETNEKAKVFLWGGMKKGCYQVWPL